ncbi:hypothetical protein NOCA2240081 [metagenome]|uniref:Uncharacterized protein n=1 Tax=metagenome TaxID=256318 RepID=A0A2P2BZX6_9ZZZZ
MAKICMRGAYGSAALTPSPCAWFVL